MTLKYKIKHEEFVEFIEDIVSKLREFVNEEGIDFSNESAKKLFILFKEFELEVIESEESSPIVTLDFFEREN